MRQFDQFRREVDADAHDGRHGRFNEQALGLLTSSRLAEALDLSQGRSADVARYGTGNPKIFIDDNGAPRVPQSLLLARRLIEAGARVVTLNYSKWDWHGIPYGTIFSREAEDFPVFDQCVSALIERSARPRARPGLHGRRVGRVRPHAQDQRQRGPRPLAQRQFAPAGRRRHEDGPGDRRDRPDRGRRPSPGR